MSNIEEVCKDGHILEKVMISGINGPLRLCAVPQDSTEIIYRCMVCKQVFNKIEFQGMDLYWNKKLVPKESKFDNVGNLVR